MQRPFRSRSAFETVARPRDKALTGSVRCTLDVTCDFRAAIRNYISRTAAIRTGLHTRAPANRGAGHDSAPAPHAALSLPFLQPVPDAASDGKMTGHPCGRRHPPGTKL